MKLLLTAQGQSRLDKPRMLSVGFKVFYMPTCGLIFPLLSTKLNNNNQNLI